MAPAKSSADSGDRFLRTLQGTLERSHGEQVLDRIIRETPMIEARVSRFETEVKAEARRAQGGSGG